MPSQPASQPVQTDARQLRQDAACLARLCAAADLPEGLWVHDLGDEPADLLGVAIGSGHAFSRWAGDRLGRRCVGVAAARLLHSAQQRHMPQAAAHMVEATTLHEVAHILWGRDRNTTAEIGRTMARLHDVVPEVREPARSARDHGLRWAATLAMLAGRATRYRRNPSILTHCVESDLAAYGWRYQSLIEALGCPDPDARLVDVLDPSSIVMRRLLAQQLHFQRPLMQTQHGQHTAAMAACTQEVEPCLM